MANNKEIAHQILTAVGGASNLKDATHCMTRLRLYLKDDSIPKDEEVKAIGGVLGVVRGGQQYQVIIGTNVPKVYEELCKLANLTANAPVEDAKAAAEDAAVAKPKLTPKQVGKNIMGYMAGCMTPLIPVLLAGALFRCINSLCGPELLGLYPAESDLYILFDFLYDAAFYFMPILAGFNAAKQLGITPMLGGFIGCILMVPDFAAYATSGEPFTVFGIPCTVTNYAQTVLPIMLSVFFFSVVYKLIKKIMPDVLTTVFTPFLSMLISIPFSVLAGLAYSQLVNRVKGSEMMVSTYVGFSVVALMCIGWLVLPFNNASIVWPIGDGLRTTITLEEWYDRALNRLWAFSIGGIDIPVGLILVIAVFCILVKLFMKSHLGLMMKAAGSNPNFAKANGVKVDSMRTMATIISTILGGFGIIIYAQGFGFYQLYNAPLMMAFPAIAAVLIGGATPSRVSVFNVVLGTIMFQSMLAIAVPVANSLIPEGNLSEVVRTIVSNGIILYALSQMQGGKK